MCVIEEENRPRALNDEYTKDATCAFGGDVLLESENEEFQLVMRWDGNLVLLHQANLIWATGTRAGAARLDAAMQSNNVVTGELFSSSVAVALHSSLIH